METLTEKILDYLQLQAENSVDLFSILFTVDRRAAMRRARHSMVHGPPGFRKQWSDLYRTRRQFYSQLNQLKRDGLVTRQSKQEGSRVSTWHITADGKDHLACLKERKKFSRRFPRGEKNGSFIIVAFDVPERERRKRDWLRINLVALGFSKLQHSVWVGKIVIPEDFFKELREHDMLEYVHIFSVNKAGTIVRTL